MAAPVASNGMNAAALPAPAHLTRTEWAARINKFWNEGREAALQAIFLAGENLIAAKAGLPRKRGRAGGRPKSITASGLRKAQAMLASGGYSKGDVARELGVSRHTLWRELARNENGAAQ